MAIAKQAIWVKDYEWRIDAIFDCPGCPSCKEPVYRYSDDKYHCVSCGKIVRVDDPKMIEYFRIREERKNKYEDCHIYEGKDINGNPIKHGCGGIGTMEVHMMRNPVTLEWQPMGGHCIQCGMSWIV